ncbi:MAG: hypothetical protein IPK26_10975 [Planctomycetes bacterium]|nr:hypothetical protein [Planctomycetota bacterium]
MAADFVLKGEPFSISSDELESSMIALADSQREAGESSAEAFARLARDRDSDVAKLYAAMDVRRVAERHAQVLARRSSSISDATNVSKAARTYADAERRLDDFIKQNTRPGESHSLATARLAREDSRFVTLYSALDEARRLAVG